MYEYLYDLINQKKDNPLASHFLKTLFSPGHSTDSSSGVPDISGYTLVYLKPPALSGLSFGMYQNFISQSKNSVFLAQEFAPPDQQIVNSDISSTANVKVPFGLGKSSGGNLTISFLENTSLDIYSFHHTWFHYIEDVILGNKEPSENYILENKLDYASCAYIIKYKPDFSSITYVGKATGIFPVSLPTKELIGSRNNYQVTIFTVPYICTDYYDVVLKGDGGFTVAGNMNGSTNWVLDDFQSDVYSLFNDDIFGLGSALGSIINPFKDAFSAISNEIKGINSGISSVINGIGSIGNSVKKSIDGATGELQQVVNSGMSTINLGRLAKDNISAIKGDVKSAFSTKINTNINRLSG